MLKRRASSFGWSIKKAAHAPAEAADEEVKTPRLTSSRSFGFGWSKKAASAPAAKGVRVAEEVPRAPPPPEGAAREVEVADAEARFHVPTKVADEQATEHFVNSEVRDLVKLELKRQEVLSRGTGAAEAQHHLELQQEPPSSMILDDTVNDVVGAFTEANATHGPSALARSVEIAIKAELLGQTDDAIEGDLFELEVPPNVKPGMKLQFSIPGTEETVMILVPEGAEPGHTISFPMPKSIHDLARAKLLEHEGHSARTIQKQARGRQARQVLNDRQLRQSKAAVAPEPPEPPVAPEPPEPPRRSQKAPAVHLKVHMEEQDPFLRSFHPASTPRAAALPLAFPAAVPEEDIALRSPPASPKSSRLIANSDESFINLMRDHIKAGQGTQAPKPPSSESFRSLLREHRHNPDDPELYRRMHHAAVVSVQGVGRRLLCRRAARNAWQRLGSAVPTQKKSFTKASLSSSASDLTSRR